MAGITVQSIERLVASIAAKQATREANIRRLIVAYCRVLWHNQRQHGEWPFEKLPLEVADDDAFSGPGYPPDSALVNRNGELAIEIRRARWTEITTSSDLCQDFSIVDAEPGLYVTPEGTLLGRHHSGKRCYGHGGRCTVFASLTYEPVANEFPMLEQAEKHLRELAQPLLATLNT